MTPSRPMMPLERTPKTLADVLEAQVLSETPEVEFGCESKEEAIALAAELATRGWRARHDQALSFTSATNEMKLVDLVSVDGRR